MPEYLTKEEEKEWRRSLEKITLEEFAARRGKVIPEKKYTNDLIDRVMGGQPVVTRIVPSDSSEKLTTIKPVVREVKEIKEVKEVVKTEPKEVKQKNEVKVSEVKQAKLPVEKKEKVVEPSSGVDFAGVEFEKPLTDREQKVFEMFYKNAGKIVYAKDLADLLALPRDYVYKYIKTLRAKIKGDKLENADKGGYVLKI